MGEINFFAPYILKERKKQQNRHRIQAGILIVLLIAGGISGALFIADLKTKANIKATENYLASPEIQDKINKMETMKLRMEIGDQYYKELQDIDARIDAVDFINVKLMDTLASTLPAGCTFTEMTLDVNRMDILGTAVSNRNVAEIEYNLKKTGLFKEVNVSEITTENNARQFSLNAIFR